MDTLLNDKKVEVTLKAKKVHSLTFLLVSLYQRQVMGTLYEVADTTNTNYALL